ncbi:MAG: hypothetical protein JXA67_04860 [Micromonosporaceae bacterium]|nr:hypothetical protein [Micromonosporaceae bacterium]
MVGKIAFVLVAMFVVGKFFVIPQARRFKTASRRPALGYTSLALTTLMFAGMAVFAFIPVSAMEIVGGVLIAVGVTGTILAFLAGERPTR